MDRVQRFGVLVSVIYIVGFVVALLFGIPPLFGGRWKLSEGWRAITAGSFAFGPALYFALEYFLIRRIMRWKWSDRNDEHKRLLEDIKTSQDTLAKVWLGMAAGIAFLYIGDYPKKQTPIPQYECTSAQNPQTLRCTVPPIQVSVELFDGTKRDMLADINSPVDPFNMPEEIHGTMRYATVQDGELLHKPGATVAMLFGRFRYKLRMTGTGNEFAARRD